MKICPFLVAGQSLADPQHELGGPTLLCEPVFATPDVDAILHDGSVAVPADGAPSAGGEDSLAPAADAPAPGAAPARDGEVPASALEAGPQTSDNLGIVHFGTPGRTGSGTPPFPARAPQLASLECLGETCRFFHAGSCRFDALFETRPQVIVPSGDLLALADGESESASSDGASQAASARAVLEEIWSLQRESLREVMNGFRRLDTDRQSMQSGITSTVESHAIRLGSGVDKVGTQVAGVAEQMDHVVGQVGKVHSEVSDAVSHLVQVAATVGQVGSAVAKVESRVGESGPALVAIEGRVLEVGSRVADVGTRIDEVGARFDTIGARVDEVGNRIHEVGVRVEEVGPRVSEKLDDAVARIDSMLSQVGRIGAQVEQVGAQVTKVASQVTSVAAAVAAIESKMKGFESNASNTQSSMAVVAGEIQDLRAGLASIVSQARSDAKLPGVQGGEPLARQLEAVTREVRQLEATLRSGVGESMRTVVQEARTAAQQAVTASEAGLRSSIDSLLTALRSAVQESKESVRSSVGESHAQLGSLLARASAETRAQLERGLAKMLEEMNSIREVRIQVQAALEGLSRETREVGALARRVESSQVLTHELLDEQRQVHAKMDERERREQARQLNNAGVLSYHQGAYDASVDRFREATELDPSLAEAFNNLGLSYTEMGRDEEATVAFQRALELDPSAAHVYNNLGYLYYRRGDLNHAVEMYQRAIQRGADSSAAYSNLANAYYRLRQVDQAVAAWRRALEIDPSNAKAAAALERLGLEPHPQEGRV